MPTELSAEEKARRKRIREAAEHHAMRCPNCAGLFGLGIADNASLPFRQELSEMMRARELGLVPIEDAIESAVESGDDVAGWAR